MASAKLQIALYWGAGCGGCDVAVLDTDEFVLDVADLADIRMWPIVMDGKYADIETLADRELDEVLGESYGIFSGRAKAWAKLKFTPARARWISASLTHGSTRPEAKCGQNSPSSGSRLP